MRMLIITVVLALAALGIAHFVRNNIRRSREELKDVDRSKLRDLDHDDWNNDSWGDNKQDGDRSDH